MAATRPRALSPTSPVAEFIEPMRESDSRPSTSMRSTTPPKPAKSFFPSERFMHGMSSRCSNSLGGLAPNPSSHELSLEVGQVEQALNRQAVALRHQLAGRLSREQLHGGLERLLRAAGLAEPGEEARRREVGEHEVLVEEGRAAERLGGLVDLPELLLDQAAQVVRLRRQRAERDGLVDQLQRGLPAQAARVQLGQLVVRARLHRRAGDRLLERLHGVLGAALLHQLVHVAVPGARGECRPWRRGRSGRLARRGRRLGCLGLGGGERIRDRLPRGRPLDARDRLGQRARLDRLQRRLGSGDRGGRLGLAIGDRAREVLHRVAVEDLLRRLGVADHQPAVVHQALVEAVHDAADGLLAEVDQHVAADHEVHAVGLGLHRRIEVVDEVQAREPDHALDAWRERVAVLVGLLEVLVLHVLRHLAERPVAVHALVGLRQRLVVDVGAVDQHVPARLVAQQAVEQDRERVRLLARGAGGAPDAQALRVAARADQLGEDLVLQRLHLRAVAEEVGLVDRHRRDHRLERGDPPRTLLGQQVVQHVRAGRPALLERGADALLQVDEPRVGDLDARPLTDELPETALILWAERAASPDAHWTPASFSDPPQTRSRSKMRMRRSPARATDSTLLPWAASSSGGAMSSSGTVSSSVTASATRPTVWPSASVTRIGVLTPTGTAGRPRRVRRSITGITRPRRLMTPGSQWGASGTGEIATMRRISPTLLTGSAYSLLSTLKTTSWIADEEPA